LENRYQHVLVNNTFSNLQNIEYGVIQGSTLGPLLFLIYINNISKIPLIHGEMFLYADDTALLFDGDTWDEAYQHAERGLLTVKRWFDQNRLTVNVGKTKYMAVSLRAVSDPVNLMLKLHTCDGRSMNCKCEILELVSNYKYLGIVFDNRLNWSAHIHYLNNKLRKCIFMFSSLSRVLDSNLIKVVYYAYVQSIFQYGIIAWGGALNSIIQPLSITQKSIMKTALNKPLRYPSDMLFESFKVFNVKQLYIKSILLYSFKHQFKFVQKIDHVYLTRHQLGGGIVTLRISKSINSTNAFYLIHILYQHLPEILRNFQNFSVNVYKKKIYTWLIEIGRDAANDVLSSVYAT
jgi:hypothetical protein